MTAILLDIDGVLHVSGDPIPGAADAVRALRADGHRLRFVTNNTTRARAGLARELQEIGIELDEDEVSTTPIAAGKLLAGMRVLALTMASVREDLAAHVTLVEEDAEAVLHAGAFVAGLEYTAQVEAEIVGKQTAAYFEAALAELDSKPGEAVMVGDDVEADIGGAKQIGMRGVLVRTGKFRPAALEEADPQPDAVIGSIAELPAWIEAEAA